MRSFSHTDEADDLPLTSRDRALFRALMNHDYHKSKPAILQDELIFRHTHPGQSYYLRYDYTNGAVKMDFHLMEIFFLDDPLWMDRVSRVASSGGRMRLDIFVFRADEVEALALPLRRNTARVDTTLQRLANELPNDRNTWDMEYVTEALAALALPEDLEVETH